MSSATKRMATVVAIAGVVVAACGGTDGVAPQTTGESEQSTAESEQSSTEDEESSPSEPTDQDQEEPEATGQGDGDFCVDMNSSVAMATGFADDVEGRFDQGMEELEDLRSRAPTDIADDVETLYESIVLLDEIVANYGYDLDAVPSDEQQEFLAETGVGEAMARISEFCGGSAAAGAAGALTGAGVGSFTVNGESFDNVDVYRCEPFSFGTQGPDPEDLDLVAGFLDGSNVVQVTVSKLNGDALSMGVFYSRQGANGLEQFEGGADNSIPGRFEAGPWMVRDPETGEEIELGEAPYVISGDQITGALTGLTQSWPQDGEDTVDVTFDLGIPSEINDCSTR